MAADTTLPRVKLPPRAQIVTKDTVLRVADSMLAARRVDTPDYKISKDTLEANVEYKASDSIVLVIQKRDMTLYSKAETKYNGSVLDAGPYRL